MNAEFIAALKEIEKEKGISAEIILEAVESSLVTACKNHFGNQTEVTVNIDRETGDMAVFTHKEVVDFVENEDMEISLEDAVEINEDYQIGDTVTTEVEPENFGRIAATKAKQVVVQKIREAERGILNDRYISKEQELISGRIQRETNGNIILDIGKVDAILKPREQVRGERYTVGRSLKVYVTKVVETSSGPKVYVSRTHPELVKRLFEKEVPEVADGIVEIKAISREAGSRTKIAVYSSHPEIDAIGACVGQNGTRVNVIGDDLQGEKIDIIPWSEDLAEFISAALSPSKVVKVQVDEEEKSAKVVVPDYQLSLAIGKDGQNARLAARLTNYKIDIKNETQAKELNFITEDAFEDNPFEDFLSSADFDLDDINLDEINLDDIDFDEIDLDLDDEVVLDEDGIAEMAELADELDEIDVDAIDELIDKASE